MAATKQPPLQHRPAGGEATEVFRVLRSPQTLTGARGWSEAGRGMNKVRGVQNEEENSELVPGKGTLETGILSCLP